MFVVVMQQDIERTLQLCLASITANERAFRGQETVENSLPNGPNQFQVPATSSKLLNRKPSIASTSPAKSKLGFCVHATGVNGAASVGRQTLESRSIGLPA
jgi:hypothetical protein